MKQITVSYRIAIEETFTESVTVLTREEFDFRFQDHCGDNGIFVPNQDPKLCGELFIEEDSIDDAQLILDLISQAEEFYERSLATDLDFEIEIADIVK
jgi:hypothetical protein